MNCSGSSKAIGSEACQINDLDHSPMFLRGLSGVSEACQINDLDHWDNQSVLGSMVSEACRQQSRARFPS